MAEAQTFSSVISGWSTRKTAGFVSTLAKSTNQDLVENRCKLGPVVATSTAVGKRERPQRSPVISS